MRKLITILFFLVCLTGKAQTAEGYWYGTANAENAAGSNNYLVELIVKQSGTSLQGIINYYFRKTFRSFKVSGRYNAQSREVSFSNIPLTYFGSKEGMDVDCPMDFSAQLRVSKVISNLTGRFGSKAAYKNTCPDIVFNLKLNNEAGNQDSILTALRQFKEQYQVWTPSATDTLIAATIQQRPIINYVVNNQFKEREKEIEQEIVVDGDSLQLDFYDNGEVDGDSISIFYNDKLLASSQRLSAKAIKLRIGLDPAKEINELSMFADNLGSIPPNTALMMVYDGKKRYEVRLSSTLKKNGTVHIRRRKT